MEGEKVASKQEIDVVHDSFAVHVCEWRIAGVGNVR